MILTAAVRLCWIFDIAGHIGCHVLNRDILCNRHISANISSAVFFIYNIAMFHQLMS